MAKEEALYQEIGQCLRAIRETLSDLTQKEWAEKHGFGKTQYNNWESGARRITVDEAERLCHVYGLTLDFIDKSPYSTNILEARGRPCMIEALAHDIGTLDRLHQPPAIIAESAASSAYLPIVRKAEPPQQRRFVLNKVYSATSEASAQAYKQVREVRSLTEDMVRIIDPRASAQRENREKVIAMLAVHRAFAERIEVLKSDAALEGFAMSVASKRDFWTFIRSMPFIRKGSLILMDNGNLRAVWKDDQGNQIGLQYLGTGSVQFVIFKHPDRAGGVSRVAGCTSLADIKRQIRAFSLERLLVA